MDTTKLDDLLNEAEAQEENQIKWTLDQKYDVKNFYVDEHGTVEIKNKTIEDMSKHISVKGESYSQYIEFKMNRFYDGIDLTNMLLAIYYDVPNVGSDESKPINVYYNETEIKFGWAIPLEVAQTNLIIDLCVYARGKLSDGNNYILKTKTAKYLINDGLELGSGVIQPTENWYTNFVFEMDSKVQIATDAANSALNSYNASKQAETIVLQSKQIVEEKSKIVDTQYKEILPMHKEVKQFRDEAKQFRDEAFATTPDGYEEIVETVAKNTVKIDTVIEKAVLNIENTASGENIHVTDSANAKVREFALFGKAKQNTTSGNQLFDLTEGYNQTQNGITVSIEDGKVKVVGTPIEVNSNYNTFIVGVRNTLKANVKYTVKISEKIVGVGLTFEATGNLNLIMDEGVNTRTNSLPEESISQRVAINIRNNVSSINKTFEIMLNEGETALSWEHYTGGKPSPSPEYKQEIEVPNGNVVVKSCGKNLLKNTSVGLTKNGITFVINEDKSITVKGTATDTCDFYVNGNWFNTKNILPVSGGEIISSGTKSNLIQQHLIYNSNAVKADLNGSDIRYSLNDGLTAVMYRINRNVTINNFTFYPMIRLASDTDNTYEPYKETTSSIPVTDFAGIPVESGGNYTDSNGQQWICDKIVKYADGSGERVQRIYKYVFNGTEVWNASSSVSKRYITGISGLYKPKKAQAPLSNMFVGSTVNTTELNKCRIDENNSFYYNTDFDTLDDFKAHLAENNMIGYYELETPIRTPLTAEEIAEIEKLHTFNTVTNISNDADCGMSVTYIADTKRYIDSKIAELATAMVSNI